MVLYKHIVLYRAAPLRRAERAPFGPSRHRTRPASCLSQLVDASTDFRAATFQQQSSAWTQYDADIALSTRCACPATPQLPGEGFAAHHLAGTTQDRFVNPHEQYLEKEKVDDFQKTKQPLGVPDTRPLELLTNPFSRQNGLAVSSRRRPAPTCAGAPAKQGTNNEHSGQNGKRQKDIRLARDVSRSDRQGPLGRAD